MNRHHETCGQNAVARSQNSRDDARKTNAFTEHLAANERAELLLPVMFQKRNTLADAMPEIDIRACAGGIRFRIVPPLRFGDADK
jgi:hypothetical protein